MRHNVRKNVTVNDIALYLARGAHLLPDLYNVFLEDLANMERQEIVSLVPITILQRYHNKLRKVS